jgi:hypothetical protein
VAYAENQSMVRRQGVATSCHIPVPVVHQAFFAHYRYAHFA